MWTTFCLNFVGENFKIYLLVVLGLFSSFKMMLRGTQLVVENNTVIMSVFQWLLYCDIGEKSLALS